MVRRNRHHHTILVGFDGSAAGGAALSDAIDITQGFYGKLHIVHVRESADAEAIGSAALQQVSESGTRARLHYADGPVAGGIIRMARDLRADLVVLGHRGVHCTPGLAVGSVVLQVTLHCHATVMIVRPQSWHLG